MSSKIEWTEETWNPVTGCTKISPGCANCYAERMAKRLAGRYGYPADDPFRVTMHPDRLEQPLRWTNPRRVFVCSMGDLFHPDICGFDLSIIFNIMRRTPAHTYQVLTKRADLMYLWCKDDHAPDNVWLGVTAENQEWADKRIPDLLGAPAAIRFVSVEPMLGPVELCQIGHPGHDYNALTGFWCDGMDEGYTAKLDWVIIGCESGPNRRPMQLEWAIDLVAQCRSAGVACFVKQIPVNGKVSKDPDEWPEVLRVREYPA